MISKLTTANHREDTRAIGRRWEDIAVRYLERSGYGIISTNWQIWWGEIDIVAQKDHTIIFVEVKFRQKRLGGSALESLSCKKQYQFQRSAELFLLKQGIQSFPYQYDFIAIDQYEGKYQLSHFKNIELNGVRTR